MYAKNTGKIEKLKIIICKILAPNNFLTLNF
jgi:hypothetical protein